MLCDTCRQYLADRRELTEYNDGSLTFDYRRNAAIILVTLARRRKRDIGRAKYPVPTLP